MPQTTDVRDEHAEWTQRLERLTAQLGEEAEAEKRARAIRRERGQETDEDIDERIWESLCQTVDGEGDDTARILALPDAQRAYFVTRLFEWLSQCDGGDAILDIHAGLLDAIAPCYRLLGLEEAADAFERYRTSDVVAGRLANPDEVPSDDEIAELNRLADPGRHPRHRTREVHSDASGTV